MKRATKIALLAAAILLSGCADKCEIVDKNGTVIKKLTPPAPIKAATDLDSVTSQITSDLVSCKAMSIVKDSKVAVTSFVPNSNISKTSDFGRLLCETLASKMHTAGVEMIEAKAQKTLTLSAQSNGDFALSRDVKNLRNSAGARFVVVGYYDNIDGKLQINSRLLDLETSSVLSVSSILLSSGELVKMSEEPHFTKLVSDKKNLDEAKK